MKTIHLFALATTALFASTSAIAQVPNLLPFQNHIVDDNGVPLGQNANGDSEPRNYDVIFRIYDNASAGNLLWTEQQTVTIDRGLINVQLGRGLDVQGQARPPLEEVFSGLTAGERFLSTSIQFTAAGSYVELLPRIRLLGNPRSLLAENTRALVNSSGSELFSITGDSAQARGNVIFEGRLTAPEISGSAAQLTNLNAANFSHGTIPSPRIPSLSANLLISGTLNASRFPNPLPASVVPNVDASQITSGRININRFGGIAASINPSQTGTFTGSNTLTRGAEIGGGDLVLARNRIALGEAGNQEFGLGNRFIDNAEYTVLWGNQGGILGSRRHGQQQRLRWDGSGGVEMTLPLIIDGYRDQDGEPITNRSGIFGPAQTIVSTNSSYFSIIADGMISASGFVISSDRRIKDSIMSTKYADSWELIKKLEPIEYHFVDREVRGANLQHGFLAQKVQELAPPAVQTLKQFVPDIYAIAVTVQNDSETGSVRVTLEKPHGLNAGDVVQIFHPQGTVSRTIMAVSDPQSFEVPAISGQPEQLFIYGREVGDFLSVDYSYLYASGVQVLQDLVRNTEAVDRELAELEAEADALLSLQQEIKSLADALEKSESPPAPAPLMTISNPIDATGHEFNR